LRLHARLTTKPIAIACQITNEKQITSSHHRIEGYEKKSKDIESSQRLIHSDQPFV